MFVRRIGTTARRKYWLKNVHKNVLRFQVSSEGEFRAKNRDGRVFQMNRGLCVA